MSVYKDRSTDCWWVFCRFKDINGVARRTTKRGFKSEEEAKRWEGDLKSLTISEVHHPVAFLRGLRARHQADRSRQYLGAEGGSVSKEDRAVPR